MSAITLILTDAGLAALTNPAHTGTSALTVTHVGLSQTPAGSIEAQKTLAVLPGEFKRLTTFGGEVMTPRVIHLSVRDESVDAYQLRSFALYLSNGVLAAVVSSTDPIMEKVPATTMVQSLDLAFSRDIEAELVFGDFTFVNPPATTDRLGVVELATVEETLAGVDPARVVTVFGLGRTLLAWAQNFAARAHGHMIGDIDGLANALLGKAAIGHQHAASDITSGTFNIARIPAIAMSGITGLVDALSSKAAIFHEHAASDITSGTFNIARIPAIAMSGITGLVDALASKAAAIHQHAADDIISGVLAVGRIPALGMEKITGLANAMALKANADGANLTGIARIASFFLGTGRAYVYPAGDGLNVRVGAAGVEHYWSFTSQGNMLLNGGPMWHLGNFDPESRVSVAATNLGSTWNVPLTTLSSAAHFAALPTGFSSMITPHSVGTPGGYGYFFKVARRDSNDGWSGLWINHIAALGDAPELYVGTAMVGTALPTWTRAWTTANFNPALYAKLGASVHFADIMASRGDGTGVISLGDSDHYLYWNGGAYVMPNGSLYVNGHPVWTTQTLLPATPAQTAAGIDNSSFLTPAALWSFAKSIGPSGYVQIPGTPIIMQWGVRAATVPEGPVDTYLPIAFGGGCLFASATPRNASGVVTMDFYMQVMGRWQDRISWYANRANGGAGNMSGFEWMAIGLATGNPDPAYYSGGGGGGGGGGGEFNPEL